MAGRVREPVGSRQAKVGPEHGRTPRLWASLFKERVRVGLYGHYQPVRWGDVFAGPPLAMDVNDER